MVDQSNSAEDVEKKRFTTRKFYRWEGRNVKAKKERWRDEKKKDGGARKSL